MESTCKWKALHQAEETAGHLRTAEVRTTTRPTEWSHHRENALEVAPLAAGHALEGLEGHALRPRAVHGVWCDATPRVRLAHEELEPEDAEDREHQAKQD